MFFPKDVRRLRAEIAISFTALTLLTWAEWRLCTPARNPRWYEEVLPVAALFISWWVLIAKLIHGDAPAGDRQSQVTRPYIWYKLLLAKALFAVTCIGVPLLVSQVLLLLKNGAPIAPDFGKAVLDTLDVLMVGVLPVAAFATITRSISQWILCLVAAVALMAGMAWLDSEIPNSHVPTGTDISDNLQAIAFTCLAGIGVTISYARRHRRLGTVVIGLAVVAVPVIMVATPYRAILTARFPLVRQDQIPFVVAFVPQEHAENSNTSNPPSRVEIPIKITSIPDDTVIRLDGVMLSMNLPDGRLQVAGWQPTYQEVPQEGKILSLGVEIDGALFNRVRDDPMPVRLSIALSQLADQHRRRIVARRTFRLAGVGFCWLDGVLDDITCRSTASGPPLLMVTISDKESTCPSPGLANSDVAGDVSRILESNSAAGPLSPLSLRTFYPSRACTGTPVVFSAPELVRRVRLEMSLGALRLGEYAPKRVY